MTERRSLRALIGAAALLALLGTACAKKSSPSTLTADQSAVKATIENSVAAENAKDVDAFLALWTDEGLESYDVGSREELPDSESFGEDEITIAEISDITVDGDTAEATVDAAVGEANVALALFRVKFAAIRDGDGWLLNGFEFIGSPPPAEGVEVIDVEASEYAFALSSETAPTEFAFRFENVGEEQHELTFFSAPDGVDLVAAKAALEDVDGSELTDLPEGYEADHLSFTEPGDGVDVTFAEPVEAGTYVLACYIPVGGFGEEGPIDPAGEPHIKLGMIATLTVA